MNSVVKKNINKKFVTSAVLLDVKKAFDQVWHVGVLHKMKNFGINQNLLRWIKSFFNERTISAKIKKYNK